MTDTYTPAGTIMSQLYSPAFASHARAGLRKNPASHIDAQPKDE